MTDTLVRKHNEKFNNRQIRNLSRNSKKHKLYDRLQIKMLLKLIFSPYRQSGITHKKMYPIDMHTCTLGQETPNVY